MSAGAKSQKDSPVVTASTKNTFAHPIAALRQAADAPVVPTLFTILAYITELAPPITTPANS
jgi:hypothetical protein